ncbi:MAG: UvrB/UvrC motif-containing protein [Clostridiales bacterium]|jgi:protein arginine kinase activator|nr:UvrB/UvrC motif-containing protein [Clostridiales bacterium]
MICQKCKKAAASVCISQVVDFHKVDIYLCQDCANESAAAGLKAAFGFFDSVPGQFVFGGQSPYFGQFAGGRAAQRVDRCDACGKTFAEIQKDGKIGCARCYDVFREKLLPIVERIHGSARHKGRAPIGGGVSGVTGASGQFAAAPREAAPPGQPGQPAPLVGASASAAAAADGAIKDLKDALERAIRSEEYEKAADIRDRIRSLEANGI